MEFGLFNSLYVPHQIRDGDPTAEHWRLMDEVAVVQAADRVGFKYTWATEHHFLDEYSHLSANEVFLGYIAHATERIHIGSGIFNITPPVNHPARIAERVAMLDHLSEGRFEFGMGRGSSTTEQRDPLRDTRGVVHRRRDVEDARAEVDPRRGGGEVAEEHLVGREVRVLGEEVVLGHPGVLEADTFGRLHDRDLVHDAPVLVAVECRQHARAVEESELHDAAVPSSSRG